MKKSLMSIMLLAASILLASCGRSQGEQGVSPAQAAGSGYESSAEPGGSAGGAGTVAGDRQGGEPSGDSTGGGEVSPADKEAGTGEMWEEEEVFLSDEILNAGDTMQVMYYQDANTLCHGLDITLHKAGVYDSPEAAGLGSVELVEEAEVYDRDGNPQLLSTAGIRLLSCDLTIQNIDDAQGSEQHISSIMLAYADPSTKKVTIVSCGPAYFSASSSRPGAGDYYHYQLPQGESKDMTVAWPVPEEYEEENLYLCVTYDSREPEERQYFRLVH